MHQEQLDLLERVLQSRYFSSTVALRRILQFVCTQTANTERTLKEYEIALAVLNRPPHFDSKLDPVIRVSMKGIRERLQAYFEGEGRHERLRLSIPKGSYRACFESVKEVESTGGPDAAAASALHRFWAPYLDASRTNLLLHTDPLFFRDARGNYIRNLYVNDADNGASELADHLPIDPDSVQPCFHYLSAGEVHCTFSLLHLFHDLGTGFQVVNSRLSTWSEICRSNLILIGCTRTNRFMDSLQEETDFVVDDQEIRNLSPKAGEQARYRGSRYRDGKLGRFSEYALISRRPGANPRSAVTIIASNHGRAVEGAGNFLTLESEVSKLLTQMGLQTTQVLPDQFQILVRVDMIDLDDEVVNVEYLSHRCHAPAAVPDLSVA